MRQDQVEALVEDIFQRLDTNQDGVVTIDEFIEACQRVRNHPQITSVNFCQDFFLIIGRKDVILI